MSLILWAAAIAFVAVQVAVYFKVIKSKMAETAIVLGKADIVAASSGFGKVWARLLGWKTNILAWIAVAVNGLAALPHLVGYIDAGLLQEWQSLPWATIFDAKVAAYISFGIAAIIPLTHSFGLNQAAKTPPQGS